MVSVKKFLQFCIGPGFLPTVSTCHALGQTDPHLPAKYPWGMGQSRKLWAFSCKKKCELFAPGVLESFRFSPTSLRWSFHLSQSRTLLMPNFTKCSRAVNSATCTISCQLWYLENSAVLQVIRLFYCSHRNTVCSFCMKKKGIGASFVDSPFILFCAVRNKMLYHTAWTFLTSLTVTRVIPSLRASFSVVRCYEVM